MPKVQLEPAHRWQCPDCQAQHFVACVEAEFTVDELNELKYEHGIDPLQDGEFVTAPKHVVCSECFGKFETDLSGGEE